MLISPFAFSYVGLGLKRVLSKFGESIVFMCFTGPLITFAVEQALYKMVSWNVFVRCFIRLGGDGVLQLKTGKT